MNNASFLTVLERKLLATVSDTIWPCLIIYGLVLVFIPAGFDPVGELTTVGETLLALTTEGWHAAFETFRNGPDISLGIIGRIFLFCMVTCYAMIMIIRGINHLSSATTSSFLGRSNTQDTPQSDTRKPPAGGFADPREAIMRLLGLKKHG